MPARIAAAIAVAVALAAPSAALAAGSGLPSGGAGFSTGPAPTGRHPKIPPPPSKNAHGTWLRAITITEYWPAPESWFRGELVGAPGLPGKHRIGERFSLNLDSGRSELVEKRRAFRRFSTRFAGSAREFT